MALVDITKFFKPKRRENLESTLNDVISIAFLEREEV